MGFRPFAEPFGQGGFGQSFGQGGGGGSAALVTVTTFTQSVSAELGTDDSFELWTTILDLTQYSEFLGGVSTINKESVIVHSGSFAARMDVDIANSSALIRQQILGSLIDDFWEVSAWVKASAAGVTMSFNGTGISGLGVVLTASYAKYTQILRLTANDAQAGYGRSAATSASIYWDDKSIKKVTFNNQITATADGTFIFNFTLPASPFAGQTSRLLFRVNASTPRRDYFQAYFRRVDDNTEWRFVLDVAIAGTITNVVDVVGLYAVDAVKVVVIGTTIKCWIGYNGTFIRIYPNVTNANGQTNTIINTLYSTGVTPISLQYGAVQADSGRFVVFDGDSLTKGSSLDKTAVSYPQQCLALLGAGYGGYNSGVPGATSASVLTDVATDVDVWFNAAYSREFAVLWIGINDVVNGVASATTLTNITTWVSGRKALGFKVLVCVPTSKGGLTGPQTTTYNTLVTNIRANSFSADAIVDLIADSRLSDPTNLTYFDAGQLHLINAGYAVAASLVNTAILAIP